MATQSLSLSNTVISQPQVTHIEERIIMEQVKATHDPNGGIDFDANFVLNFVENIISFTTVSQKSMQDKPKLLEHIQKEISPPVIKLPFEFASMQDKLKQLVPIQKEISSPAIQLPFQMASMQDKLKQFEPIQKEISSQLITLLPSEIRPSIQDKLKLLEPIQKEIINQVVKLPFEIASIHDKLKPDIQKEISSQIIRLSFEIALRCLSDADNHSSTIYLLSLLSKYPWDAKMVMMLASFAIIYGELIIVSQSCHRKRLANNLTLLRKSLNPTPSSDNEKLVDDSIKSILNLTKFMVELQPPSSMISASYWIARSVVTYASYFARLRILGLESQNELMEQSNLSSKIREILAACYPLLEARNTEESYKALQHAFRNSSNNLGVLKLIFKVKDDNDKPIFDNYQRFAGGVGMGLHSFRDKGVVLLITSGVHISLSTAYLFYWLKRVKMVWVPIMDDVEEDIQLHLTNLDKIYGYYRVLDPQKMIAPEFIRFVKEECFPAFQIGGYPIVISLDNQGRLVHTNAMHMIWTWGYDDSIMGVSKGGNIIPYLEKELRERTTGADRVIDDIQTKISDFAHEMENKVNDWVHDIDMKIKDSFDSSYYTSERELALWAKETWNLKLVLGNLLENWINEETYIFLCGGNDVKCAQEFALKVREVRSKSQLNVKFAYVGRSNKVHSEVGSLSDAAPFDLHRLLWTRLLSVAFSRIQYLSKVGLDEERDEIMQGLKKLLAYEAEGAILGGWILLSKGKKVIACDVGDNMLEVMNEYENWKDSVLTNGFDQAFKNCYEKLSSSSHHHPFCALNYPSTLDHIPKTVTCPQCNSSMHKFVTYTCCHGHDVD